MSAFCSSSDDLLRASAAWGLGCVSVLIDGEQLARLLIRYNVGCRDDELLHLKKTDEGFFAALWNRSRRLRASASIPSVSRPRTPPVRAQPVFQRLVHTRLPTWSLCPESCEHVPIHAQCNLLFRP